MIKVVYDYQAFWWQRYGGISRYFYEIATRLFNDASLDVRILAGLYVNEYLKHIDSGLVAGMHVPKVRRMGTLLKIADKVFSRSWLKSHPPQIVHETFYSKDSVVPKGVTTVLTVYDLIDEKFRPNNSIVEVKAAAIERADHLICISENTRADLLERFDIAPEKTSVIYLASSLDQVDGFSNFTVKANFPYILFVGERGGYKNFERLLRAYANSRNLVKDLKLICFGGNPLNTEEVDLAISLGIPEGNLVRVSGDDSVLVSYYQQASVLAYPSLYEGFGFPPLEALSLGCPVACSNTSSMPEVSGNAAEYFDPYEVDSITGVLEKIVYSQQRKDELISLGHERCKLFSWDKIAEKTSQLYQRLV